MYLLDYGEGGNTDIVYKADCSTITSGFCTDIDDGVLYFWNGTAVAPHGVMIYPVAGVPVSSGSAWGTSLVVGGDAIGELVQVQDDGSGGLQLPFALDLADITDTTGILDNLGVATPTSQTLKGNQHGESSIQRAVVM